MVAEQNDARRGNDPAFLTADLIATVLLLLALVVLSLVRSLVGLVAGTWSALCWEDHCTRAFFNPGTLASLGGFWLIVYATVVASVLRLRRRTLAFVIPLAGWLASSAWLEWLVGMSPDR